MRDVCFNLKRHFDQPDSSKAVKQVELFKSKFFLLDVCFEKSVMAY